MLARNKLLEWLASSARRRNQLNVAPSNPESQMVITEAVKRLRIRVNSPSLDIARPTSASVTSPQYTHPAREPEMSATNNAMVENVATGGA